MNQSFEQLKQDISSSLNLSSSNSTGWMSCYCPMCNKTDRMTAGLRFEGDTIQFNCFRASCQASCVYELGSPVTKKFRELSDALSVSIPVDLRAVRSSMHKKFEEALDEDLYKKNFYTEMKVPPGFIPYDQVEEKKISMWKRYMERRNCSMEDTFYVDSGMYRGKLALGCYFFDKLIGFQIILNDGNIKYINETENENVIYINQRKIRNTVIVVEGALDAKCFPNTIAMLSHKVTPEKAFHLRGKDVILLPDKSGGDSFIQASKDYGWKVSLPDWNEKDLNAAVEKYGIMVCAEMILDATLLPSQRDIINVRYRLWKQQ